MKIKIAVLAVSLLAIASQANAQRYGCNQSSTPTSVTVNRYYYYPPSNITYWDYSNPCHTQYRNTSPKFNFFGIKVPNLNGFFGGVFRSTRSTANHIHNQPYRHVIIHR